MKIASRTSRALLTAFGLGAVIASLGFSCEKSVNDSSVALEVTVRASLGENNIQGGGDAALDDRAVAVSADGRYVAFASKAPNMVPGDLNGNTDVFVRDMVARTTRLVSVNVFGTGTGNGASGSPSISADGNLVAFFSTSSNLHAEDVDVIPDVFVRNMSTGEMILVSRASGALGSKGNGASSSPAISADGRYVAFESIATNLDGIDPGGDDDDVTSDIYRRDIGDPTPVKATVLISRQSTVGGVPGLKGTATSVRARISGNGRFVAFESDAPTLVLNAAEGGPDGNIGGNLRDCFVRDVDTELIRRVSLTTAGTNPNGSSDTVSISEDGRFAIYRSSASNIHPDDDGAQNDIFLFDTTNGTVIICSQHTFGTQAGNSCNFPVLTSDGRFAVFQSQATSLVNGDTNNRGDIFRHDRLTRETIRLSVGTYGSELNGDSFRPAVSADGRYIAFVSDATNAADDDTNGAVDVYLRGPPR